MDTSWSDKFFAQLPLQTDLRAAGQLLAESAIGLGWDLVAFHDDVERTLLPRSAKGELVAVAMGWSDDYIRGWIRHDFSRYCPVTQQCGRVGNSFAWKCDPDSGTWEGRCLSAEQRDVLEYYSDCVAGAVTVPVHRPGGKTGYVSWFARSDRDLSRLSQETYDTTYLISHAFIHNLARIERHEASNVAGNALTRREIECLNWAARGKTEEEIGTIIERSRETVHFHLGNAARKLDANNRTHAVAIACSRGLITVL